MRCPYTWLGMITAHTWHSHHCTLHWSNGRHGVSWLDVGRSCGHALDNSHLLRCCCILFNHKQSIVCKDLSAWCLNAVFMCCRCFYLNIHCLECCIYNMEDHERLTHITVYLPCGLYNIDMLKRSFFQEPLEHIWHLFKLALALSVCWDWELHLMSITV